MSEELFIIDEAHFGLRDAGRPVLWFGIRGIGGGSLQVIEYPEIARFLKENDVRDIADLAGRAVICEVEGNKVEVKRLFK